MKQRVAFRPFRAFTRLKASSYGGGPLNSHQSVRHIDTSLPYPAIPASSLGRQAAGFPSPQDRRLGQILLFTVLFASARGLANTAIQAAVDPCASPTVVYVDEDATGKGTGLSWKDAFTVIQQAINTAASRKTGANAVEVWVAEGTYDEYRYLTGGQGQNLGSVQMKPGVALYGGFDGTEFRREQRDWFAHETIIDGSRSQTGKPAYHVVLGANEATLDGFTITGGNASVPLTDEGCGGGMLNKSCSPLVANCTFLRNQAYTDGGGGIGNIQAAPRIVNCRFYGNNGGFSGGAISNNQSSPEIVNCLFVGNQADEGGAMICRDPAAPRIINCTFVANHAGVAGALCYVRQMELVNSILWANRATNGRGDQVYAEATATTATFSYCSIEGGINLPPGFRGAPVRDGGHNLVADPCFARMPHPGADGTWGTKDDDYGCLWLLSASPLIDKGDDAVVPADVTEDVARHPRICDAAVDLGAYESGASSDPWAVVRPMIGLPVIQERGKSFQIEIRSSATDLDNVNICVTVSLDPSLNHEETSMPYESLSYDPDRELWILTASLPDHLTTGLYDLTVAIDGREQIRPNAVSVISEFSPDPLIYHITDIHVDFTDMCPELAVDLCFIECWLGIGHPDGCQALLEDCKCCLCLGSCCVCIDPNYGTDGKNWKERTSYFEAHLKNAKELDADFILIGGDNVDWSTNENWQRFYDILKQSEVPTFVQLGNHDYRTDGEDLFELPQFDDSTLEFFWENICSKEHFMNYSFDYGNNLHVIGLNSGPDRFPKDRMEVVDDIIGILGSTTDFFDIPDKIYRHFLVDFEFVKSKGLTDDQMAWLDNDLSDSRNNVVFFHNPVFWGNEWPSYDDAVISNCYEFRDFCHNSYIENRDIVAVFSGHTHADDIHEENGTGTKFFITDTARYIRLSDLTKGN